MKKFFFKSLEHIQTLLGFVIFMIGIIILAPYSFIVEEGFIKQFIPKLYLSIKKPRRIEMGW